MDIIHPANVEVHERERLVLKRLPSILIQAYHTNAINGDMIGVDVAFVSDAISLTGPIVQQLLMS